MGARISPEPGALQTPTRGSTAGGAQRAYWYWALPHQLGSLHAAEAPDGSILSPLSQLSLPASPFPENSSCLLLPLFPGLGQHAHPG